MVCAAHFESPAITDRRYGPNHSPSNRAGDFFSHANEKLRILGEIPLRKFNSEGAPILDAQGDPDTSFLAKIPADTPFTFQTLDRNGMVLNMSQTWHQVRPGEQRSNCGGCHAHSQMPMPFSDTAANEPTYNLQDLAASTPLITRASNGENGIEDLPQSAVNVEFYTDIRPLLQSKCISCHNGSQQAGQLVLDDTDQISGLPGDYKRLADDQDADYGYEPVIPNKSWRQTNRSRYIRAFQSRRSLLTWKLFGERLDGWSNADHPTETTPGDANTLPDDTSPNEADLDFIASSAHPTGGMPSLTMKQKMTFARWIDLGAPIDTSMDTGTNLGWFIDDDRPTLTISQPRQNVNNTPVTQIVIGVADAYTGIDLTSLSIKADFVVNGHAANTELRPFFAAQGDGVFRLALTQALPIDTLERHIMAEVKDNQGNVKRMDLRFFTSG